MRGRVSLLRSELEEPSGLARILLQTAEAIVVEIPETELSAGVALVSGELVEARGLAVVLWQSAMTHAIEEPEIVLRRRVSLIRGEPVEASSLARHSFAGRRDPRRRNTRD